MAWRPTRYLIDGELNNTQLGKVTGWMRFAGMQDVVKLELSGDFHRDIRGAAIRLTGQALETEATQFMEGFCSRQSGQAGDITAGLPPNDYGDSPYIEWYSEENGRVVVEPEPENIEIVGTPLPPTLTQPVSRAEQDRNMGDFLRGLSRTVGVPAMTLQTQPDIGDMAPMTHWVTRGKDIIGEARPIEVLDDRTTLAHLKLGRLASGLVGVGTVPSESLRRKADLN